MARNSASCPVASNRTAGLRRIHTGRSVMNNFEGVVPALGEALNKRGYSDLTPVQKAVLQAEHEGADALVSAQTGSGKTVAFGIAIAPTLLDGADRFSHSETPLALVVAPTRELALQVKRELQWLYAGTGAIIASCVGGMDMRAERRLLERGAHIVVGTPGRLCDHIRRNSLDTGQLKAVILDEADEMLDLGFREDLEFILETTPEDRRTLMFSATVPQTIAKLARQYQRDAVRITTSEEKQQHVDIEYRALTVAPRERENAIINVLRFYEAKNALVFCNTRATVNHMVARFNNRGFSVVALSGELSQNERTHALQAMRDGRARVCIATDVAARGIDLPNLDLVIHAELPTNPETLLHRSGRTGRAGRKGVSALIVDHKGRRRAERLLRFAKINATWAAPPSADDVNRRDEERILAAPMLTEPMQEEERDFVQQIMASHTPEQVATAFVRLNRAGQSAPEDLQEVPVHVPEPYSHDARPERGSHKQQRQEFDNSIWFSLSVGRKQNAEPRWLIPLICNAGGITKREIGSIKMQNQETFVQLNADHAEGFFEALGPNLTLEKNITVKRLDGTPKTSGKSYDKPAGSSKYQDRKPWNEKPAGHKASSDRKAFRRPETGDDVVAEPSGERNHAGKKHWSDKPAGGRPAAGEKPFRDGDADSSEPARPKRRYGPRPGEEAPREAQGPGSPGKAKSDKRGPKKQAWARKKTKPGARAKRSGNANS